MDVENDLHVLLPRALQRFWVDVGSRLDRTEQHSAHLGSLSERPCMIELELLAASMLKGQIYRQSQLAALIGVIFGWQ